MRLRGEQRLPGSIVIVVWLVFEGKLRFEEVLGAESAAQERGVLLEFRCGCLFKANQSHEQYLTIYTIILVLADLYV